MAPEFIGISRDSERRFWAVLGVVAAWERILRLLFAYLCKNEKRPFMVDNLTIMLEKFSGNFENSPTPVDLYKEDWKALYCK